MSAQAEYAELLALSTVRTLTSDESDAMFRAHLIERNRQSRLPERIMRLRAQLHAAEAELWPCYLPKLRQLEDYAASDRITAIEREIGADR